MYIVKVGMIVCNVMVMISYDILWYDVIGYQISDIHCIIS